MGDLVRVISLRFNFFIPTIKLVYYGRNGIRGVKRYEIKTIYKRIVEINKLSEKQEKTQGKSKKA